MEAIWLSCFYAELDLRLDWPAPAWLTPGKPIQLPALPCKPTPIVDRITTTLANPGQLRKNFLQNILRRVRFAGAFFLLPGFDPDPVAVADSLSLASTFPLRKRFKRIILGTEAIVGIMARLRAGWARLAMEDVGRAGVRLGGVGGGCVGCFNRARLARQN